VEDYYNVKRVSNSSLNWLNTSPRYFWMMFNKELEQENLFIYKKGTMVHSYILEPKEFDKQYVFLDYDSPKSQQQKDFCSNVARFKKGKKEEILVRAYKDCYATKESDEKVLEKAKLLEKQFKNYIKYIKISTIKTVLSKNSLEKLENIKKEISNHKIAQSLLINESNSLFGNTEKYIIENELKIYWNFLGVDCKSMLDRLIIDHENKIIKLVDLKTTSAFEDFNDKLFEYRYYRQLSFYWLAIYSYWKAMSWPEDESKFNIDEYKKETYIVAINMKEPTEVKVYDISPTTLNKGLDEIEKAMKELKWHFDNNQWEHPRSYYEGTGTIKI